MRELVIQKLQGVEKNVTIIPNWADLTKIHPHETRQNQLLRELGLADRFIIQYAGNMARVNDVESIVQAAVHLANRDDIHFLFIGAGAKRAWLEQAVNAARLPNVTIHPPLPRSDQETFLNACHVGVIALNAGMKGVSVPSRSYNIMAAGKPILAIVEPGTETDDVIKEEGIGWTVPPGHPELLAKTILTIQSQPEQVTEKGRKARQVAERLYSLDTAIEKYRQVIHRAASRK
jgi:glycosyltransferase involved in cell wall biosynthesis